MLAQVAGHLPRSALLALELMALSSSALATQVAFKHMKICTETLCSRKAYHPKWSRSMLPLEFPGAPATCATAAKCST